MFTIYEYIERAIKVEREFSIDRQYVVKDGEVIIVDEFTGRLAEGRKWRGGLHQAVEAKEGIEVLAESGQAARITIQDYFLLYPHLAGMTGTAITSAGEMRRIYKLRVVPIPTKMHDADRIDRQLAGSPFRRTWPAAVRTSSSVMGSSSSAA